MGRAAANLSASGSPETGGLVSSSARLVITEREISNCVQTETER